MAKSKRYNTKRHNLPFRGNVVDIVQHHEWVVLATEHSEGQNLGLYAVPLRNLKLHDSQTIPIETSHPIVSLTALPNEIVAQEVTAETITIDGEEYDARMMRLAKENAKMLVDYQESTIHSLFYALIDEQGAGASEITELEIKTLEYIKENILDEGTLTNRLDAAIQSHEQAFPFSIEKLPGQRVLGLDTQGNVHLLPVLGPCAAKEHPKYQTQEIPDLSNVEKMVGYSEHEIICVCGGEKPEVVLYDLRSKKISFRMDIPQVQDSSISVEEGFCRVVTSIAASTYSDHFALGFDDGLYLIFSQTEGGFDQKSLYNADRTICTALHDQPVIAMHFYMTHDGVEYVTAAAADLTMSAASLRERIPMPRAKNRGPKKNIRQFLAGPSLQYFYSISEDNALFTWNSNRDTSASIEIDCGPISTGCIPRLSNRGEWFWQDILLVGGVSSQANSGAFSIFAIRSQLRNEPSLELSLEEEKEEGRIREKPLVQAKGCAEWIKEQMAEGSPQRRLELIELLGTWKDELSVFLLRDVIYKEENPKLITRALELFHATNHPKRSLVYKSIMDEEIREATCMLVLDYLRSEDILGEENLYPLNLARYSSFLPLRQKVLRGYADLASKRDAEPDQQLYRRAQAIVLESLHDDEDDIVDVAFSFLFDCEQPLLPGVEGVLTAIAVSDERIQRRGLELLYTKGMLQDPQTKEEAQDLLRQLRDSGNERLRYRAFILSLTTEVGVQTYLRCIDEQVDIQLRDLEEEEWNEQKNAFDTLDAGIEKLFLSAISEENEEQVIDETQMRFILDNAPLGPDMTAQQYLTFSYCLQTFPMTRSIQETLRAALDRRREAPKPLHRDLSDTEVALLQEMSFSYQPQIASLGALALSNLGHVSALPILLQLVDDRDALVRSRAIDGLMSFIHEPIVEQRLFSFVLQAPNIAVRKNSDDKAKRIRAYVKENSMKIKRSMVDTIVEWIFEDNVYSQTERLALRYIFESVEITFSSDTRTVLFKELQERASSPKDENLRAKAFSALFAKASKEGGDATLAFIRQTQDSVYEDIRMLGITRLQQRISAQLEATPNWKEEWHFLTEEDWKTEGLGAFVQADDGSIYESYAGVNPAQPVIGIPKPLLKDIQLLNRAFFWKEHEAIIEAVKVYSRHNLIQGDFFATRRFLLSLSIKKAWKILLQEILDNIQDTEIKGDENVPSWHQKLWLDYLGQSNEQWAAAFFSLAGEKLRCTIPVGVDDNKKVKKKVVPNVDFMKAALVCPFPSLQNRAFDKILSNFGEEWVASLILDTFTHEDQGMRNKALSDTAFRTLYHHRMLYRSIQTLLRHESSKMVEHGLKHLKTNEKAKDMLDTAMVQTILDRMEETLRSKEGALSRSFISSHFIDQEFFARIPKAAAFGEDQQKAYYELLAQLFVYEVEKDILSELEQYKKHQKSLKEEIAVLREKIKKYSFEGLSPEEKEEAQAKQKQDRDRLIFLNFDLKSPKPKPSKNKKFLSVLSLLKNCSEGWVLTVLDHFIFSMDEKISNHAFGIYFALGVQSHNPEQFLMSMLNNDHARLDDVFDHLLSGEFDHLDDVKAILTHCTRLKRIDLVFRAFDRLKRLHSKEKPMISDETWKALRSSPHPYLRLNSYEHFGFDSEIEIIQEPIPSTPEVAYPFGLSKDVVQSILNPEKAQESREGQEVQGRNTHHFTAEEEVHLFIKNASECTHEKRQVLQEMFSLSLRDLRRIQEKGLHCITSGVPFSTALAWGEQANKHEIKLVVSRSHPSYETKAKSMWNTVVSRAVEKIYTEHWVSNSDIFTRLMYIYTECGDSNLKKRCVQAMGSVATPENCKVMMEKVSEGHSLALARSGHVHGLRIQVEKGNSRRDIISSMLACGMQSDPFFLQACAGRVHVKTLEKLVLVWFLQRSAYGGSLNMMTSLLGSSHQKTVLTAADLLSSSYSQESFFNKILSLFELDTMEVQEPFSSTSFDLVEEWLGSMKEAKKKYVRHYKIIDKPELSPTLEEYRQAKARIEQITKETEDLVKERDAEQDDKRYKKLHRQCLALEKPLQEASKAYKEMQQLKHLTHDEWAWIAHNLTLNNPRIRFSLASLALSVFEKLIGREKALIEIERLSSVIDAHDFSSPKWESFSLSGRELTKQTAISFGFGSLASIIRNNRQFDVQNRRKALASIIQLACMEKVTGIRPVLSVALNDPSKKIRHDAFSLAILHHEELALTQADIVEKACHAVALRNAIERENQFDSLNELIVSHLYQSQQFDVLLRIVREVSHYLGIVALRALLAHRDKETFHWTYMVPAFEAALLSPSALVQHNLIDFVYAALEKITTFNGEEENETKPISVQPLWDVSQKALDHGNRLIVSDAQEILKEHNRIEVLPYVFREELLSDEADLQAKACDYLEQIKPAEASDKIMSRLCHDPMETANVSRLESCLINLNDYQSDHIEQCFTLMEELRDDDPRVGTARRLLIHFSGYSTNMDVNPSTLSNHAYRNDIFARLLTFLLKRSRFDSLQDVIRGHIKHLTVLQQMDATAQNVTAYAESDRVLSEIAAIRYREGSTDLLREKALDACCLRYELMTESVVGIPVSEQTEEHPPHESWGSNDWAALRYVLDLNLSFHPILAQKKKSKSVFQYKSACALLRCRGYLPYAFRTLREILTSDQYSLSWRSNVLELLGETRSFDLLPSLFVLVGMDNKGEQVPSEIHGKVPRELFYRAVSFLGYYHTTDRSDHIFTHLLRLADQGAALTAQVVFSLSSFVEYSEKNEQHANILLRLTWNQKAKRGVYHYQGVQHPAYRIMVYTLMELYTRLSTGDVPASRAQFLTQLQEHIENQLYKTDINAVYEFSCRIRSQDDVVLDGKLYRHKYMSLLSSKNHAALLQRLKKYCAEDALIDLVKLSIRRQNKASKTTELWKTELAKIAEENRDVLTHDDVTSFIADVAGFVRGNPLVELNALLGIIHHPSLALLQHALCVQIQSVYARNGTLLVTPSVLKEGVHTKWSDEVNNWEEVVSDRIDGAEFYRLLAEKSLSDDFEFYESVLDILSQKEFSDKEKDLIISNVRNLRVEWSALQKEKSLGVQGLEEKLEGVVQNWNHSLRLLSALKYDGGELTTTLCMKEYSVPLSVQKKVLEIYLDRSDSVPSQDVLMTVFNNEPALRALIVPLFLIQTQQHLIQTVDGLRLLQTLLESWLDRIDSLLRSNAPDAAQWLLITENSVGLLESSFPRMLRKKLSSNASDLASFWKESTRNKAARKKCVEQLLVPICIGVLRRKELPLASHFFSYGEGRVGYQALQFLNQEHEQLVLTAKEDQRLEREKFEAEATIEEIQKKNWSSVVIPPLYNPFVLQSLKYARDPEVRKGLSELISQKEYEQVEKDLRWVREIERRKSQRFTKELS